MSEELPYDKTDKKSIERYAQRLVGKTLREMVDAYHIDDPHRRKGSLGNAVEELYFKYRANSDSAPDFSEAGLELKVTPVKKIHKGSKESLSAKERLVIGNIDYMSVVNETFESSHLMSKIPSILFLTYRYEKDKDPLDYVFEAAGIWNIPEEDMPQIKADWNTVVDKVRSGHAEDISGSDTLYLEAATKAANSSVRRAQPYSSILAKPRAWAFKASYMTGVQQGLIARMQSLPRSEVEKEIGLLDLIRNRFSEYVGMTEKELQERFGLSKSKHLCARITNRILGVDSDSVIAEFVKAGIKPKTIRLQRNGRPKEAMSFPSFDYFELEERPFEDSDFLTYLQQKYLFVVYRESAEESGVYELADVCLWQMPDGDLLEAKKCYEQMRENVRQGRGDVTVKSTENRCCHVRPHARNAADTRPQPHGEPVTKKCFWLNQSYLESELRHTLDI